MAIVGYLDLYGEGGKVRCRYNWKTLWVHSSPSNPFTSLSKSESMCCVLLKISYSSSAFFLACAAEILPLSGKISHHSTIFQRLLPLYTTATLWNGCPFISWGSRGSCAYWVSCAFASSTALSPVSLVSVVLMYFSSIR